MEYVQYLDEKVHQLKVVCMSQWDYVSYGELCNWLEDNFGDDVEGKYYATKILLHTVYYKKKDIEALLLYGLNEKLYGEIIKQELISTNNIYISNSVATAKVNQLKEKTFFVPLLDSNKPSESGNGVLGDLVHKHYIHESQTDFHFNITREQLQNYNILVFVDDCVGSGMQLKKFWNSDVIQKINSWCIELGIKIYYLVLVGYDKNLETLKQENKLNGIDIIVCDLLTDRNRVFSDDNIIWDKHNNEKDNAIKYFERIRKERGINLSGFKNLDFAIILHDRLPNWSLPIFWKDTSNWKPLLKRKSSINR